MPGRSCRVDCTMRYSMLCDICIFCLLHIAKNSMSSILFWKQPVTIKQNSQETTWETTQTSDPSIREHTHLLSFLYVWSSTPSFGPIISKDIFNQTVFSICVCVRSILAVWWWYSVWSWPAECGHTTRCVMLWIKRNAYSLLSLSHGRQQHGRLTAVPRSIWMRIRFLSRLLTI